MCMAVPSRVIKVCGDTALTECFGQQREVSLVLLGEAVAPGDYLLIQTGGFAFERLDAARAQESLALMEELVKQQAGERVWGRST